MDSYNKFRREIMDKLLTHNLDTNAILDIIDSVVINYTIDEIDTNNNDNIKILNDYINSCKFEKMSDGTIKNYYLILKNLLDTINLPISEIRTVNLRNYLKSYQSERDISDNTLNKYREYVRTFWGWCYNEGYIDRDVSLNLNTIHYEYNEKDSLTQTELEYIREVCTDVRERAIIEVLYSTGCRVSELCNLKLDDINWNTKTVHLFGKGKKHRQSYLNAKAEVYLKKYLETRTDESEYVFVTKRGCHKMTPSAVQKMYKRTQ